MSEHQEKQEEKKVADRTPGQKGELGVATAGLTVKQMYHRAHFQRVDAEDKGNPNKKRWIKNPDAPSLKQFARQLLVKGDTTVNEWLAHKNGSLNQARTDKNIADAKAAASATKMERRKRSSGKK